METLAKLFVAFLEEPTWKQKELERRCEVSTRAIRRHMLDLQAAGVPVEREEDPPHVYWSVPPGWFPSRGTGLDTVDQMLVARLVSRLPKSDHRERILEKLIAPAFGTPNVANASRMDVSDAILSVLEDSAKRAVPVHMGYYSASSGESGIRVVSVQRLVYGPWTRFVGYCHRSSSLKWFRADRVANAQLDAATTFIREDEREVDQFVAASLDGYHGGSGTVVCRFVVRGKDRHWIIRNLPQGAATTIVNHHADEAHVELHTSAIDVLARYLLGYASAVSDVQPTMLHSILRKLAREAFLATGARLNGSTVRSIRPAR